jgi:arylsulfatase A-like enzyme/Flp pilus assembly protein TadD
VKVLRALLAAAIPTVAAAGTPPVSPPYRPSVVLVTLDTTRADHLGCYGASGAATPRLDALARNGVRFTQALSPVPLTAPAHASILTGRVPRRHGLRDNAGFTLDAGVPTLAQTLQAAGYDTAAFVSAAVLDRAVGLNRGFARYDDSVRVGDRRAFDYQERAASQTVDAVLDALPSLKPPYFLWVHFYDPHFPYVPPEPYATRFAGRPYDGEIAFVDAQIGRLLDALRRRGDAPLVIAAGDHGESLGEHGEETHGIFLYQATQHVPLIVSGPGIPAGRVPTENAGLVDVAPTVLDAVGLPPLPAADGRSLLPAIRGAKPTPAEYEMETFYPSFAYGWAPLRALVSGPYKYVDAPRPELYELPTDAREKKDLSKARKARTADFARALEGLTSSGPAPQPSGDGETEELRARLSSLGYVGGSKLPETGAIDPKDGVALLRDLDGARRSIQEGSPRAALAPLDRLLVKNPGNIPARLALGQAQLGAGMTDAAVATYRGVTERAPENALAWFDLGNAYAAKGAQDDAAFAGAKAAYEHALTLFPRHADTYLNYAALCAARKKPEDARGVLLRGRSAGVADPTLETELGALEIARRDAASARAAFTRALALNPREPVALEGLGKLDYAAGQYQKAAEDYARALEAKPSASLAKTLGAIRLYQLQDKPGALEAFTRALALTPPGVPEADELRAMIAEVSK